MLVHSKETPIIKAIGVLELSHSDDNVQELALLGSPYHYYLYPTKRRLVSKSPFFVSFDMVKNLIFEEYAKL